MRFYVAGPLSADTDEGQLRNVERAMTVSRDLLDKGHIPFCPHLTHFWDQHCTKGERHVTYEQWMTYDREWLNQCQAFFFIASSPGASRELGWALALGLPVYTSLEDVPDAEVPDAVCSR